MNGAASELHYLCSYVSAIYNKLLETDREKSIESTWRHFAIILDRWFFIITTLLVVSVSCSILLAKPPYERILE